MADLPDLSDVSPDRWLSRLDELRTDVQNRLEETLEENDDPEALAEQLEALVDDVEETLGNADSSRLLEIERRDARVAVRTPTEANWLELTRDGDRWRVAGDSDGDTGGEHRAQLAERLLQQVPWWSDGAFASKVGEPERFTPDDDG